MNQWNERYNKDQYHYGTEPNDFLDDYAQQLLDNSPHTPAKVLCLADGEGRNSVYLAELGAEAVAVDISEVGLKKARNLAKAQGVQIETELLDLTTAELPEQKYDGVVMVFCHLPAEHRPYLYKQIGKTLKSGGWLLAECYTKDQLDRDTGGPPTEDLMLNLQEFRNAFPDFTIEHSEELVREIVEGEGHSGEGAVCQYIGWKP